MKQEELDQAIKEMEDLRAHPAGVLRQYPKTSAALAAIIYLSLNPETDLDDWEVLLANTMWSEIFPTDGKNGLINAAKDN